MRTIYLSILLCITPLLVQSQNTYTLDSTVLTARTVITGIDIPWEIVWGPDDHIWMTERFGRISRVNPTSGAQDVLLDLSSEVYVRSEAGLLGMVLHPEFESNPYVYCAYTYLSGNNILEKLVQYTYDGDSLSSVKTILDNIKGNTTHIGSRLLITPDKKLLMTTGDAQDQTLPQNVTSLVGKVLRLNLDGSIPSDNPNPDSYVWSWGHRNAQGLCLAPNGVLYSSEHGPTTDDELNILQVNRNYGWPKVHGLCDIPNETTFCNDSNVFEPLAVWTPTIAPSDIAWYDHPAIPEWQNKLLMTVLKNKQLIAFSFDNGGTSVVKQDVYFTNEFQRLRDICISPSGRVYLATNGNSWQNNNPFTHSIIELSNVAYHTAQVKEIERTNQARLFPNPVTRGQMVHINLKSNTGKLKLYNALGQLVMNEPIGASGNVGIASPAGMYTYVVEQQNGHVLKGTLFVQ